MTVLSFRSPNGTCLSGNFTGSAISWDTAGNDSGFDILASKLPDARDKTAYLFLSAGISGTTISGVHEMSGVSMYRYFGTEADGTLKNYDFAEVAFYGLSARSVPLNTLIIAEHGREAMNQAVKVLTCREGVGNSWAWPTRVLVKRPPLWRFRHSSKANWHLVAEVVYDI